MKSKWVFILCTVLFLTSLDVWGSRTKSPMLQAATSAQQQSNQPSDVDITRNIRRALVKDKSLSMRAHNVTIITKQAKVVLRGSVKSETEKQAVEAIATNVAGQGNVTDELTTASGQ